MTFTEFVQSNPGCVAYIIEAYKSYIKMNEMLDALNEKYPVEGYDWDIDPNRDYLIEEFKEVPLVETSGVTLVGTEGISEKLQADRSQRESCMKGHHNFIDLTQNIHWCEYCGTISIDSYKIDDSGMLVRTFGEIEKHPQYSRFLNKVGDINVNTSKTKKMEESRDD